MSDPELLRDVLARDPLLLTPEEAATVLGIGRTTVYALMKAGELHPVHIGRSCRLPRAELERFVGRLQAPPPTPAPPRRSAPPADHHEPGRTLFDFVHSPRDAHRSADPRQRASARHLTLVAW
ncbi:DNA binding domain-containing protein, excisionase family [Geodermatophilus obscurus]|uniref:DNA binding domain-containing protein, excisionase family n=1 Tax=Geodermatophilus obscurus TaxID=1861 RepID=A0A1I5IK09_9ACTN|nr:helix-turn-helix domain-containing protein [Geodermatophilus obscurus]SFO60958.1 DNA binding domain-containing protein, excisionase family [Geodermatophilus obscurus]